jgi:hypothetical protein
MTLQYKISSLVKSIDDFLSSDIGAHTNEYKLNALLVKADHIQTELKKLNECNYDQQSIDKLKK